MNLEDQTMSDIADFVAAEVFASQGMPSDHPTFRSSVERAWQDRSVRVNEARLIHYGMTPLFLSPKRKYFRQIVRAIDGWVLTRSDHLCQQLTGGGIYVGTYWPRDAPVDSGPPSSPEADQFELVSFDQGGLKIMLDGQTEATTVLLRDVLRVERLPSRTGTS